MKSSNSNELSSADSQKKSLISPVIMKSRGARFLDLVKNNKLNVSPQLNKRISGKNSLMEKFNVKKENPDYLKFSDKSPNLNLSPSSSILSKRKPSRVETPDSPSQNSAKVILSILLKFLKFLIFYGTCCCFFIEKTS